MNTHTENAAPGPERAPLAQLHRLLELARAAKATAVFFIPGQPVALRVDGEMRPFDETASAIDFRYTEALAHCLPALMEADASPAFDAELQEFGEAEGTLADGTRVLVFFGAGAHHLTFKF